MRITSVELVRLELELVSPLATSQGTHRHRPLLLVRIATDDAEGIGECSALAEAIYTSEYADGAEEILASSLIPALVAGPGEAEGAAAFFARLDAVGGHPMAKAAVEMALLDAELVAAGRSFAELVGAVEAEIPAGATIGIASPEVSARAAAALVEVGFGRIKLKIAPGSDLDAVRSVGQVIGFPALVVDANGSYRPDDREHLATLRAIDALGLAGIEQPFAADELAGHAALRRALGTPIVLDESVSDADELDRVLELGSADVVSVKPARLGGIANSLAICAQARAGGLGLTIGGMLESGIGRAVAIALGAAPGFDMPGDLGPSDRYFARDLTRPHVMDHGALAVPRGPGIGIALDEEAIASHSTRRSSWRPS